MFDDIIRDKANEHGAPVPPDAWNNIIQKKKKRRFAFFWWSSAFLLMMGLSIAGYLLNKPADEKMSGNGSGSKPVLSAKQYAPGSNKPTENTEQANGTEHNLSNRETLSNAPVTAPTLFSNQGSGAVSENSLPLTRNLHSEKQHNKLVAANRLRKKTSAKATYQISTAEPEEINTAVVTVNDKTGTATENAPVAEEDIALEKNILPPPGENNTRQPSVMIPTENKKPETNSDNKKISTPLTKQSNKHHWFIDASVTPLLPIQQYDENISFNRTQFLNNNFSIFSAKLVRTSIDPSMAFGLSLRREFSKKLDGGIGLQYLVLKESLTISGNETSTAYTLVQRLVAGINGPELVNDSVATVTEGKRTINAVNSYHLLSIPVFMQYRLVQKKSWNLGITGGIYLNISSRYQNEINRDAAALLTSVPTPASKTNLGLDVFTGLRIAKTIGQRFEFFAMPAIRWNLSRYNTKNSLLNKSIQQVGLSVGISYKVN